MTIAVKRYTSLMTGAPSLTGQVGTLVTLLDACLVTGFNTKSVSTAEQTAGVATVTTSTAHGYAVNDVVAISGANEAAWNNEFRVLTAATHSFTFAIAAGTASPATGTLSVKIAPLGWTKPFSGTNKAAYLPQTGYCQIYLRVLDDSTVPTSANGRWAKWRGYETMTDIDTGTGLFPTVAQMTNGANFCKSNTSSSATRAWWLAGDGGIFYLGTQWATGYSAYGGFCFGDIPSLRAGDAYNAVLMANHNGDSPTDYAAGNYESFNTLNNYGTPQVGKWMPRNYTQVGSAITVGMIGDNGINTNFGQSGGLPYPNPANNGLLFSSVGVFESGSMRCLAMPGLYHPLHTAPLSYLDTVTSIPNLPGITLQAFDLGAANTRGLCLIDITGPWR